MNNELTRVRSLLAPEFVVYEEEERDVVSIELYLSAKTTMDYGVLKQAKPEILGDIILNNADRTIEQMERAVKELKVKQADIRKEYERIKRA